MAKWNSKNRIRRAKLALGSIRLFVVSCMDGRSFFPHCLFGIVQQLVCPWADSYQSLCLIISFSWRHAMDVIELGARMRSNPNMQCNPAEQSRKCREHTQTPSLNDAGSIIRTQCRTKYAGETAQKQKHTEEGRERSMQRPCPGLYQNPVLHALEGPRPDALQLA